jgi:hypothetical protein
MKLMLFHRTFASSVVILSAAMAVAAAAVAVAGGAEPRAQLRGEERYHGFDVAKLAEATARLTTFRTQHGEPKGNQAFAAWLQSEGLSRAGYDQAYNSWWERFRADPTGQLEARFHRINSEWVQKLNFGDAKDRRLETREGVTLETYAKIAVALTRLPGASLQKTLNENGVKDEAHWQRVNEAWGRAMKEDTTFALVQQYGALYQKFAGPQLAAEQDAILANEMAKNNARRAEPPPPSPKAAPETLDEVAARMTTATGRDRREAARQYAHACDLWSGPARRDPKDPRAARCALPVLQRDLLPVLLDSLDRADDDSIGYSVGLFDYVGELGLKNDTAKLTAQRALNRAESRLATLEASFAPIRDKAVPERITLRTKIDEYTAAVKELRSMLAGW